MNPESLKPSKEGRSDTVDYGTMDENGEQCMKSKEDRANAATNLMNMMIEQRKREAIEVEEKNNETRMEKMIAEGGDLGKIDG